MHLSEAVVECHLANGLLRGEIGARAGEPSESEALRRALVEQWIVGHRTTKEGSKGEVEGR
jgi:hypothetical protein